MSSTHNRVEVMHGVNFDVLERREAEIYGGCSLRELEMKIKKWGRDSGIEARFFQSNSEGQFVEHLHRLPDLTDAVLVNAGAWTHYSYAIADALAMTKLPAIEVHISDVDSRDDWRKISVFEGLVLEKISGRGLDGYKDAMQSFAKHLDTSAGDGST